MTDKHDNNNRDDKASPEERLLGLVRLLSDQESPAGPTPTLQEIQDWHLGKLDEKRAQQVKTHVARDPACYQLWRDLIAAEKEAELVTEKPVSIVSKLLNLFKQWWTTPTRSWAGTGMVTAMLVVVVAVLMPYFGSWSPLDDPIQAELEYDWPYAGMSITRGGDLDYRQKVAIQVGLRKAIQTTTLAKQGWAEALQSLPEKTLPCDKATDVQVCQQSTKILSNVGLHTGVQFLACLDYERHQQTYYSDEYWQNLTRAWRVIAKELKPLNVAVLQEKIDQLSTSNSKGQQCGLVRDVIYMSY